MVIITKSTSAEKLETEDQHHLQSVEDDDVMAKRLDAIAFPGLTANFDASKSAALAVTLLDWIAYGAAFKIQWMQLFHTKMM